MNEFRKNLVNEIIKLYGLEHPITIDFAKTCESFPCGEQWDNALSTLCKAHLEYPLVFED